MVLLALSGMALASLSWNGHAAAGDGFGGTLRLLAGIVHLLAAGAWVGAIAAILQLALRPQGLRLRERTYELWRAAHGFALPGTVIVALLAMTGTYTYVDLGGSVQTLTGTAHGLAAAQAGPGGRHAGVGGAASLAIGAGLGHLHPRRLATAAAAFPAPQPGLRVGAGRAGAGLRGGAWYAGPVGVSLRSQPTCKLR